MIGSYNDERRSRANEMGLLSATLRKGIINAKLQWCESFKSWDIFPVVVQIKFFGSSVLGDD